MSRPTDRSAAGAVFERGGRADAGGRFVMHAAIPWGVVVFYVILILLVTYIELIHELPSSPYLFFVLVGVLVIFLARMLSTRYVLDADRVIASRLFGSRRARLDRVRKIEHASLRELAPVSLFGGWGWRGRAWSPTIGRFDSLHTTSAGVLVTVDEYPMFLTPRDPPAFARELSRRVRSYVGEIEVDVGAPGKPTV
jgi:hypothetical protein